MSHQRQQIREAVKTALVGTGPSYATAAGVRVFETRLLPLTRLKLPAISVYCGDESITDNLTAPRILTRTMQLRIEAAVQEGSNIDDSMDAICVQIERAMHADPTFGAKCCNSVLSSIPDPDITEENDKFTGVITLIYTVTYETHAPDPEDVSLPDDFTTVGVTRELSIEEDSVDDDQSHDLVEIEVEE